MKVFCTLIWTVIVAIVVERCRAEFLLVKVDDAAGKVLKQEGEPCGEILFEPDSDCGECDEGLVCEPYISPAPPAQCGKCVKRKVRDRIDQMDSISKKKAPSRALPTLSCLPSSQMKCSPDYEYEIDERTGEGVVACPVTEDPDELGNFISFQETAASMTLEAVCMTNCGEPRPKECHCGTMLDNLLARITYVNEIKGTFTGTNFMAGCRCYLGAAARAKFEFVQMDEPGFLRRCEEKKRISANKLSPDYYVKVCDTLLREGCEDKPGRITVV